MKTSNNASKICAKTSIYSNKAFTLQIRNRNIVVTALLEYLDTQDVLCLQVAIALHLHACICDWICKNQI